MTRSRRRHSGFDAASIGRHSAPVDSARELTHTLGGKPSAQGVGRAGQTAFRFSADDLFRRGSICSS